LVWLGFRRDYPISEAMTSFFFTFFKVFLNGCLGLFVAMLPRKPEQVYALRGHTRAL
jgi:hypothetical protein